jgi:hypothetical protein
VSLALSLQVLTDKSGSNLRVREDSHQRGLKRVQLPITTASEPPKRIASKQPLCLGASSQHLLSRQYATDEVREYKQLQIRR